MANRKENMKFSWYIPKGSAIHSESGVLVAFTAKDLHLNDRPRSVDFQPYMKIGVTWNSLEARYQGRVIWKQRNFTMGEDSLTDLLHNP